MLKMRIYNYPYQEYINFNTLRSSKFKPNSRFTLDDADELSSMKDVSDVQCSLFFVFLMMIDILWVDLGSNLNNFPYRLLFVTSEYHGTHIF